MYKQKDKTKTRRRAEIGPDNPPERMSWVSSLIIEIDKGGSSLDNDIILVKNKGKPPPHYPKLPGGQRHMPENYNGTGINWYAELWPEDTLYREILDEILRIKLPSNKDLDDFYSGGVVYKERIESKYNNKPAHMFYVWAIILPEDRVEGIKPGDEIRELIRVPIKKLKYEKLSKGALLPKEPWLVNKGFSAEELYSGHEMALYSYFIQRASDGVDPGFIKTAQKHLKNFALIGAYKKAEALTSELIKFGHSLY